MIPPQTVQHTPDLLAQIAEVAAPGAQVSIVQAVSTERGDTCPGLISASGLVSRIKLAGLTKSEEPVEVSEAHFDLIRSAHFVYHSLVLLIQRITSHSSLP